MRIAVLSDTHAPRFWKRCPMSVARHLEDVDLIVHAGDVCIPDVLEELSQFAPVRAVQGNNDVPEVVEWGAGAETLEWSAGDVSIAVIHDAGPRKGRYARMRKRFPSTRLLIYGHSHIPLADEGDEELVLFNPGSPTDKRRQPVGTMGLIDISGSEVLPRIVPLR